ncbi:MAG: CHAT domain-containing protein [Phaeodactylibacter sp.]|nr:CHAT domain-containing protein [Phaeodactylibacter sp.]
MPVILAAAGCFSKQGLPGDTIPVYAAVDHAVALAESNNLDSACLLLDIALPTLDQMEHVDSIRLANGLNIEVRCLLKAGDIEAAGQTAHRVLTLRRALFPGANRPVMQALTSLGVALDHAGKLDSALMAKEEAYRIGLEVLGEEDSEMMPLYNNLAGTYNNMEQFAKAEEIAQKALEICRRKYSGNKLFLGHLSNTLAVAREGLGKFAGALDLKKQALAFWEEATGPDGVDAGIGHLNLGAAYYFQAAYRKAVFHLERSLHIFEAALGEGHPYIGAVLNNLSACYEVMQDYGQALHYSRRSMFLREASLQPNHRDLGQSYHNFGVLLSKTGQPDSALAYLNKALGIYKKAVGKEEAIYQSTLTTLGIVLSEMGRHEEALSYLRQARAGLAGLFGEPHHLVSDADLALGDAYHLKGDYPQATRAYEQALQARKRLFGNRHPDVAGACNSLAENYARQGKYQEAIEYFGLALEANRPDTARDSLSIYLPGEYYRSLAGKGMTLAQTYWQTGKPELKDSAAACLDEAIAIIEGERANLTFSQSKKQLSTLAQPAIAAAIQLKIRSASPTRKDKAAAFLLSERSKAMILLEAIREANALSFGGVPDSLVEKEQDLNTQMNELENAILEESRKGGQADRASIADNNRRLFEAQRAYVKLKERLARDHQEYYRLKFEQRLAGIKEIQDSLLDDSQALLEYFVGDSSIFIFLVKKDDYQVHEVKRDALLEKWVEQLRHNISQQHIVNLETYAEVAPKLYDKLFAPIANQLPERLIIIPDGILGYVPFEALLTEAPENVYEPEHFPYLLRRHQISYSYSATLLREMQQKKHRQTPTREMLAMAPFATTDTILTSHLDQSGWQADTRGDTLKPLLWSRTELDSLKEIFHTDAFYGQDATEERFTELAGAYRFIHLPTHGKADSRVGDYSWLAFAPRPDSLENELLYVRDLYNLSLNADLVTLSACETAAGELQRGEGIISLARAFAYAGAKSIATTLWQVNDRSTQELMVSFYRYLDAGLPKDEALRQAKLDYLEAHSGTAAHPCFWAAVIGIGDMEAVK